MQIPYNGNHPWKKSFAICLLCRSSQENFRDSGNLMYKNSGLDKKCKKTFANASRFTKFVKLFFHGWFPLYSVLFHFWSRRYKYVHSYNRSVNVHRTQKAKHINSFAYIHINNAVSRLLARIVVDYIMSVNSLALVALSQPWSS